MPKVTGQLTDFGFDALEDHNPRLLFIHNTPGVAGSSVLTTRPVVVPVAHNGYFEAELVASARIAPAGYYTVMIEWTEYPNRLKSEPFPGRLYVPAAGGALADILRVPANPALVWTGVEPPANPSPGSWWLGRDSIISEYDGTGWNFKQNIRGAAGYNATGAAADDAAIARFIGEEAGPTATARALERAVLNVRGFGARGNGIADDTAAIQAAINAAPNGSAVMIPNGWICRFTTLELNKPGVSLIGPGKLTHGTLYVGSDTATVEYTSRLEHLSYDGYAANDSAKSFVVLKRCRGFKIAGNTIENTGKAISVPPTTTGFHSVAMLDVTDNRFAGVNVAFHSDTTAWDTLSDMGFIRNNVNYSRYYGLYMTGVDGVTIAQNKLFMLNYSSTLAILNDKKQNIYIGNADQVHITDNNIFEAGREGIYLGSVTNLNISGNHIVWPGQAYPSDAISINGGTPRGTIANNTFVNFTKSAIGIYGGDPRRLEIGANMYRWLETPESYFGTEPLPANAKRFRVYVDASVAERPVIRDYYPVEVFDSIQGRYSTAQDRKGEFQGITTAARRSVAVTGPDALIFRLTDIKGLPRHGGLVVVTARSSGANEAKTATYVLLISYTSTMSQCVQIASTGHTAGAAPEDPSFTWNVLGEHLRASPVGSTSHGSFWIEAISMGATALR